MFSIRKCVSIATTVVFTGSVAMATPPGVIAAGNEGSGSTGTTTTTTTTGNGPAGVTNSQIPVTTVNGNTGASQHQAALTGQAQNQSSGSTANSIGSALLAAGTAMMPPCAAAQCSCCPMAAMLIMMGIMGLKQGGANNATAGAHGAQATLNQDYGNDTSAPSVSQVASFGKKTADDLKKYGVTYDPKTGKVTMPNGKSFSESDLGNQSAMSNAGVSAEDYAKAMKMAKDAEKKLAGSGLVSPSMGYEGGGGGAQALRNPADEEAGPLGPGEKKNTGNVAGMSLNFNGDKIGVAGDDIFQMMARRYKEKDNKENFLPPDSAPDAAL